MTGAEKDLKNGSNLIVLDGYSRYLVAREKTREKRWMLPGGAIDRGESSKHAAQSETEEETGIVTDEVDYRLIGYFVQRPKGFVFLYETGRFTGDISISEDNTDASEARFMSFDEIVANKEDFRLAYFRMILHHRKYQLGELQIPYEGRLGDEVTLINIEPDFTGGSAEEFQKRIIRA